MKTTTITRGGGRGGEERGKKKKPQLSAAVYGLENYRPHAAVLH
jgi:hypothetical protein